MMPAGYHTRSFTASNLPYPRAALSSLMVTPAGFEPSISSLKGMGPKPISRRGQIQGSSMCNGLEPFQKIFAEFFFNLFIKIRIAVTAFNSKA